MLGLQSQRKRKKEKNERKKKFHKIEKIVQNWTALGLQIPEPWQASHVS